MMEETTLTNDEKDPTRELKNELEAFNIDDTNRIDVNVNQDISGLLKYTDKNKIEQSIQNAVIVLEHDCNLCNKIRYNKLTYSNWIVGKLPWKRDSYFGEWNNTDDSELLFYMESNYGLKNPDRIMHALILAANHNSYHPVIEFLESLTWDGVPRIENLLNKYLGVVKNEYSITVMKTFMLGAIARAYKPGTKFDYVPIFVGGQGVGKSSFLRALSCDDSWFCDNFPSIEGNLGIERLRGMWLIELAELLATKRAKDVEGIKAFITSTSDNYRPPFGRRTEQRQRACVFAGTTNNQHFLTDRTGNRRFLPIVVNEKNIKQTIWENPSETTEDFRQAWAEALQIFKGGEYKLILPRELQQYVESVQEEFLEEDGRIGLIEEYLTDKEEICIPELWREALNKDDIATRRDSNEIHLIMSNMQEWEKYEKKKRFGKYGSNWGYHKVKKCSKEHLDNDDFMKVEINESLPFV